MTAGRSRSDAPTGGDAAGSARADVTADPQRVVVVGYGMAGARLADAVRRRDPGGRRVALTVLGAEMHLAYNRVLLSSVVAGEMPAEAVRIHEPGWAVRHGIDLRLGATVTRIDLAARVVTAADGSRVEYDSLVLATGSRPWMPPTEGLLAEDGSASEGVVAFRTLDDCREIIARTRAGAAVAVIGGGLLGLEAARGLASRGARVTVVHPVDHLMERQLDPQAGRVLARSLDRLGIGFRFNARASSYSPGRGLRLDDGTQVPAEFVVVSAGVRPDVDLAVVAGVAVDHGVLVDDALRTSDDRVFALGDCAQHPGVQAGLVAPAWEQAEVLADLLTGVDPAARYRGTPVVTRLKAPDIDLATLGEVHTETDSADAEVLRLEDPARGRYAKVVLRGEQVTGAILLGSPDAAATVTQFYSRGIPAPKDRLTLLLGRMLPGDTATETGAGRLPDSAMVCRCNSVSKGQLVTAWRAGARDVAALAGATRATTGCGSCLDQVHGIAAWLADQEPAAEPRTEVS